MFEAHNPRLKRGVNLGGWLSQSSLTWPHVKAFLSEADFLRIAGWGFDHVRIPIDAQFLMDKKKPGKLRPGSISLLRRIDSWCSRAGLWWITDLHQMPGHSFHTPNINWIWDRKSSAELLPQIWRQIALALAHSDCVIFDLLNEPTIEETQRWVELTNETVERIRSVTPERWILIETGSKASVHLIDALPHNPPEKCIYGFHFYEPLAFTHQLAEWADILPYSCQQQSYPGQLVPTQEPVPIHFQNNFEKPWGLKDIEALIKPAAEWATDHGIALHCGEFGAYLTAPREARYRWLRDVRLVLENYHIGWCYWSYRNMGFGIIYDEGDFCRLPEYSEDYIDHALLRLLLNQED